MKNTKHARELLTGRESNTWIADLPRKEKGTPAERANSWNNLHKNLKILCK